MLLVADSIVSGPNSTLSLFGQRGAADAEADIVLGSTASRTAGALVKVLNADVTKFYIDPSGIVYSYGGFVDTSGISGNPSLTATDGLYTVIQGQLHSDYAGIHGDVTVNSKYVRTAGLLLQVANAGTSKLRVDYAGNVTLTGKILSSGSGPHLMGATYTEIAGSLEPGDKALADIYLSSMNIRTAGCILRVNNSNTTKFSVAYDGTIEVVGGIMHKGTRIGLNGADPVYPGDISGTVTAAEGTAIRQILAYLAQRGDIDDNHMEVP